MSSSIIEGYRGIFIDGPGDYQIMTDISSDGRWPGIQLLDGVANVTLHLRSRLEGSGVRAGIRAAGAAALTIIGEGGIIRDFHNAVELVDCYRVRVINLDIFSCRAEGIAVNGDEILIKDNTIGAIGGSDEYCYGIRTRGRNLAVLNNNINDIYCIDPTDEAVGISLDSCTGMGAILGNRIRANSLKTVKKQFGIWTGELPPANNVNAVVSVAHNTIENWYIGAAISFGKATNNVFIHCHDFVERLEDMDGGGNIVLP